ncbi:transcriptional repressor [Treponema sp. Marseille-Q4130]|uniref:transcriptional repressor n=1 Tax=Treponema sp. Marseille-Q4130 TaxID=2766702 RepID=UPI001651D64C|nr:transcriptional repressor [Treponema sp. Marseille-Q4130]MBC6720742.1 transcriptional repressor [Treponema sp. Marseille-Q4130]
MKYLFKEILASFREHGMRVTSQRKRLVSIILQNPDLSPKEIFYIAQKKDSSIGRATVYRLIRLLQELGYIGRHYIKIVPNRNAPAASFPT